MRRRNEQSRDFGTKKRLRQEGVLSPVIFTMIMDDMLKEIKQTQVG